MSFDPVPWAVAGGSHSPDVARVLAFAATAGSEGIISSAALKVKQLGVAGAGFTVDPGACSILNRSVGGGQQTYIGRVITQETVSTFTPTGGGGGRSDLVVVRVEDPEYSPWSAPVDPLVGPYFKPFVIEGVPAGTRTAAELNLGYSAIALARIDVPVSTSVITTGMITDLRVLSNPRRSRSMALAYPPSNNDLTSSSYVDWPSAAVTTITVPDWATYAVVRASVASWLLVTSSFTGLLRLSLGGVVTQDSGMDENYVSSPSRADTAVAGVLNVVSLRGTSAALKFQAKRASGTGSARADVYTTSIIDIEFIEAPV